ncbi:hypothetical protein [Prevotella pallens]|nr:hypothetical protein [Prevotella pallens]
MNSIYLFERQLPDRSAPLYRTKYSVPTKGLYEKKICIIAVSLSNIS